MGCLQELKKLSKIEGASDLCCFLPHPHFDREARSNNLVLCPTCNITTVHSQPHYLETFASEQREQEGSTGCYHTCVPGLPYHSCSNLLVQSPKCHKCFSCSNQAAKTIQHTQLTQRSLLHEIAFCITNEWETI